ncbi:MAG: hypothetical protein M3X11_19420 [Acidobacteriota bacterium]|nr:hypothetical protein [Acidobacteriota bacterium]
MNKQMEAAIARCRKVHPKVKRLDAGTVLVWGRSGIYTVRFAEPRTGLKLACCNCVAGEKSILCFHVVGALAAPVLASPVTMPKPAPVRIAAPMMIKPQPNRIPGVNYIDGWDV